VSNLLEQAMSNSHPLIIVYGSVGGGAVEIYADAAVRAPVEVVADDLDDPALEIGLLHGGVSDPGTGRLGDEFFADVALEDDQLGVVVRSDLAPYAAMAYLRESWNKVECLFLRGKGRRGVLKGTGDPTLDGDVEDAFDLIDRLAKSEKVRQSIIRHAFRYFLGRNETLSDSKTLIDADRAYVDNDGSFDEVIVSLLTSDPFIYRKRNSKD
jgi:hypothetical protein